MRAEVTNISQFGIWILFEQREFFLPFEEYPWFKNATVSAIHNVKTMKYGHLHWPDLDVDLSRDIFENSESYPLVYK